MNVELVLLRDELAFVRRYPAIQSVRFSDRLQVTVECAPSRSSGDASEGLNVEVRRDGRELVVVLGGGTELPVARRQHGVLRNL